MPRPGESLRAVVDSPRRVMIPITIGTAAIFGVVHEMLPPDGQTLAKVLGVASTIVNIATYKTVSAEAISLPQPEPVRMEEPSEAAIEWAASIFLAQTGR